MKIIDVTQGTPEWHAVRAEYFTASEAPAMMGVSKYQSRSDLLLQKNYFLLPRSVQQPPDVAPILVPAHHVAPIQHGPRHAPRPSRHQWVAATPRGNRGTASSAPRGPGTARPS